ncbi:uncharacterized protein LOC125573852 [Nematostella vectensis]|uniref:uncharacterized protein LOC125573852 n=1 Tax=Nematostella vectensis TaxID=45351 RepID=UPI002076DD03|nr:uncharacterized protein LOC125573852 [Nematostella vectensis]
MAASVCVDADDFYSKLEELKEKSKSSKSNTTLYICDEFYEKAKQWLKCTTPEEKKDIALSDNDKLKIIRNKWNVDEEGRVIDAKGKYVVHKSTIHDVLSQAHKAICHRGRDKTAKYLSENYNNLPKQIITLFTSLCKLHQEQASLTNYCKKPVTKPIQADGFLSHLEMDLIDFRKIPCNCGRRHLWALHVEEDESGIIIETRAQKRKRENDQLFENQAGYNRKMKETRPRKLNFQENDYVSVKINVVDKGPLHPNSLLAKIIEKANDNARIVTKFGVIDSLISLNRLNKIAKPNIVFDYSTEVSLTRASKMAHLQ